ncbi:MAG: 4Fe-4S binding protein [Bacillota bacterium]
MSYILMILIFILFFVSINAESGGRAPATFAYFFCAVVLVAGIFAYKRHRSTGVRRRIILSIVIQLVFALALPYWCLDRSTALNVSWPLYPEVMWVGGKILLWYLTVTLFFVPVVVFLFGRRAWCSYICGIGVQAETLGDGYRAAGSKYGVPVGFKILKWAVLLFTISVTFYAMAWSSRGKTFQLVFLLFFVLFLRTLLMSAVNLILMPKFGTRIWCKYFCPQGLLLGLISRAGRFALVKDKSLCTGCGTCNSHCSMAIDISGGPPVIRSTDCVGCGVCVEVCPGEALSMTIKDLPDESKTMFRSPVH